MCEGRGADLGRDPSQKAETWSPGRNTSRHRQRLEVVRRRHAAASSPASAA